MLSRGNERVKDLQSRLEDEKLAFPLRQPQFLLHLDSTIPYCILFTKKFRLNDSNTCLGQVEQRNRRRYRFLHIS